MIKIYPRFFKTRSFFGNCVVTLLSSRVLQYTPYLIDCALVLYQKDDRCDYGALPESIDSNHVVPENGYTDCANSIPDNQKIQSPTLLQIQSRHPSSSEVGFMISSRFKIHVSGLVSLRSC